MSGGLVALIDDVTALAKLASASLNVTGAAAGRAGAKAVAVVIDDTAVTPQYVQGFSPDRELPIIWRIAKGSLRNKLIILPVVLLLSAVLPGALTPLLMLGGVYLSFEGAEKIYEALGGRGEAPDQVPGDTVTPSGKAFENQMVSEAVRTDFILSTEIMVIALAEVAQQSLLTRTLSLVAVAVMITALVYGAVGILVKLDDLGLRMARDGHLHSSRAIGRGLVWGMPHIFSILSVVGTAAMLWVGGHLVLSGLSEYGFGGMLRGLERLAEHAGAAVNTRLSGAVTWLVESLGSAVFGVVVGLLVMLLVHTIRRTRRRSRSGAAQR